MIRIPDDKIKEIFIMLGADEEALDRLVSTFQTRHTEPLPLERRVEYFNFLGLEDSWERIIHMIRGNDVQAIIDFLAQQAPGSLIYKRCLEKLCHYIFSPDWLEKLGEMWHRHTLHTHSPRKTWPEALAYARTKDQSGLLAENLVTQVFKMKDLTQLVLEIRQEFATQKKFHSHGVWRSLSLEERHALSKSPLENLDDWLADQDAAQEELLRVANLTEFQAYIRKLKNAAASPEDAHEILECIDRYAVAENHPLPETTCRVRRFFFEKLIEPYRSRQYE
jgi:hypothetical protein